MVSYKEITDYCRLSRAWYPSHANHAVAWRLLQTRWPVADTIQGNHCKLCKDRADLPPMLRSMAEKLQTCCSDQVWAARRPSARRSEALVTAGIGRISVVEMTPEPTSKSDWAQELEIRFALIVCPFRNADK